MKKSRSSEPQARVSDRSALNDAGLSGLDTTARGVLAVPLYALLAVDVARIGPKLPLV